MIDLEPTRELLNDAESRIERMLTLYSKGKQALADLKQHRHQLRKRELMFRRKLAANPNDQITQLLLASTQRSRAIARKTYRGWARTIIRLSETVEKTENLRRNCDRTLTEWSS